MVAMMMTGATMILGMMMTIGRTRRTGCVCLLAALTFAFAAPASAQNKRDPKVIELEGIDVIGKVAKPQVFYVLGRSAVRYEQLKLDQSFIQRVVATARMNPF